MDINESTAMSDPALFYAASAGQTEMVEFLIDNGAEVDGFTNAHHFTPLMQATHFGHTDVVMLLIEHGANVNAYNTFGNTPLDLALLPTTYSDYPVKAEDKENCAAAIRQSGGKSTISS